MRLGVRYKQVLLTGQAKKLIYSRFPLTNHDTETANYRVYALIISCYHRKR